MLIDCQYITTSIHDDRLPAAATPSPGDTKTVLMPLSPTAGEGLRVVASPPDRIKRFEPVPQVGDGCVRDSLAVVQADHMSPSKVFNVRRDPY